MCWKSYRRGVEIKKKVKHKKTKEPKLESSDSQQKILEKTEQNPSVKKKSFFKKRTKKGKENKPTKKQEDSENKKSVSS